MGKKKKAKKKAKQLFANLAGATPTARRSPEQGANLAGDAAAARPSPEAGANLGDTPMEHQSQQTGADFAGTTPGEGRSNQHFGHALVRAFAGAIIFSLPMLMTMEMWWLGFYMSDFRLALFTVLSIPLLALLSYFAGFEETEYGLDDLVDAFVAYAVGFVTSAVVLLLLGVLGPGMSLDEIIGKIALQTIPASMGALLARDQLGNGGRTEQLRRRWARYPGQLFLMAAGGLFLAFNLAPTEEMILIAHQMTAWHALALAACTVLLMHGFTTSPQVRQKTHVSAQAPGWLLLVRYTLAGYALALLVSAYILWTFGRLDATSLQEMAKAVIVLGFPAGVGAAASQLII